MSIKKKIKIILLGICIAILGFGIIMMINNRKQKVNNTEPISEKFQNEQEIILTNEEYSLSVFLPKNLMKSDMAVKTFGQKDIFSKENIEKNGEDYDVVENNISQITVATDENEILSYSIGDKDYATMSLESLNEEIKTFEIASFNVSYSVINVNERSIYYMSVPVSTDNSLLIMIETNEELTEEQLGEYIERLGK